MRAWLHDGHNIRQTVTATVGPGGFGKTTLAIHDAVCMVSNGLKVWYLSGEDPKLEIDRRIAAHCAEHHVDLTQLPGRLFVDDQESFRLNVAKSSRSGVAVFDDAAVARFEAAIAADKIDVVILDPFISFHLVDENDNGGIDAVVKKLALIAKRCNCNIEICHHVRKAYQGQVSLTVDDARGGSAIINAVRSGRVINRMTADDANKANISEDDRHFYLRLDKGKRNMAPPDKAKWFRLVPVTLHNGPNGRSVADGDSVQALVPWKFQAATGVSEADTQWMRDLIRTKAFRCDPQSADWLGFQIASRFGLNVNDKRQRTKINAVIGQFLADGIIQKLNLRDPVQRKKCPHYAAPDARGEDNVVTLFPGDEDPNDD